MKKICLLFWVGCMGLFLHSCVPLQTYRMEILKPGLLVLPDWMKNMVVLDNTTKEETDTSKTDLLARAIMESLTNTMLVSGQYATVRIGDPSEFRLPKKNDRVFGTLSTGQALMEPPAHVLITLDELRFKVKNIVRDTYYNTTSSVGEFRLESSWTAYNLIQDTILMRFRVEDDLEFETTKKMATMDSVFPDVADYVARVVAKNLNFRWEKTDRMFYNSGSLRMRGAAQLFVLDSLKMASDFWNEEFEKGFFRSKYRAALNQVLYFEMTGRQDSALLWLKKAEEGMNKSMFGVKYFDNEMLKWWKDWFAKRQVETDKLKIYFESKPNQ